MYDRHARKVHNGSRYNYLNKYDHFVISFIFLVGGIVAAALGFGLLVKNVFVTVAGVGLRFVNMRFCRFVMRRADIQ
jgi:uncharacterized membrane protein YkvI